MAKTFPAIRSFPTRQVFVSFTDAELENRVDETLAQLQQEGQNGILSITRTSNLMFHDFGQDQEKVKICVAVETATGFSFCKMN